MTMKIALENSRAISRHVQKEASPGNLFDIIIRANGVELTDKLREAVSRKIGRVRQYAPSAFRARVQFERENAKASTNRFRVSVRYEIPGNDLVAEHRAHEPLTALDLVSEKIERRLRKRKTARLANRVGRRGRPCRIADFCTPGENRASLSH